ncbi:MAG TPA: hypothetical protein VHM88_14280 [Candidatus Acidoferrales bacterium]|nr:hypothetical protein [Candidatus Acidoferrales bacterium]
MFKSKGFGFVRLAAFLAVALTLAGCSSSKPEGMQVGSGEPENSPGTLSKLLESTKPITVPAGTYIHVTLDQSLASDKNRGGDGFEASVSSPVVVDGRTVIPKGAHVRGRVVEARESGRLSHVAHLRLALSSIEVAGKSYEIETSSVSRTGSNHKKRNVEMIGGGTALGALIGGVAGGGKGAAIGAAAGAGAGTATAAATGKKEINIPAETPLTFKLSQPISIEVKG